MNKAEIIYQTENYVKGILGIDTTGHDWEHTQRVRFLALKIAKKEGGDLFVVELAALLHDIADWKFHNGDDMAGSAAASQWLSQFAMNSKQIDHIGCIINRITFKGAQTYSEPLSLEGQIVQDADRLDAIGAIGIARAFAYGGSKKRTIYDPSVSSILHQSFEEYKQSTSPTINHFYEKLLLLKDRMNTETAKLIANERHQFMELFLKHFFEEWYFELSK